MIEIELLRDEVSNSSHASSEPEDMAEKLGEVPELASIYPPILVLEKDQQLVSICNKSPAQKLIGKKTYSHYFAQFPDHQDQSSFLHSLFQQMSGNKVSSKLKQPYLQPFLIL